MILKRDENRTVSAGAVNDVVVGLLVDTSTGALIVVDGGTPTTTDTPSLVKIDDNGKPAMALLDSETLNNVWSARCDDDGYLIMKSV